jgi:hypothetical protein
MVWLIKIKKHTVSRSGRQTNSLLPCGERIEQQPPNFVTVVSRNKLNGKSGYESSHSMDYLAHEVQKTIKNIWLIKIEQHTVSTVGGCRQANSLLPCGERVENGRAMEQIDWICHVQHTGGKT